MNRKVLAASSISIGLVLSWTPACDRSGYPDTAPWMDRPDRDTISTVMTAAQFKEMEYETSWLGVEMLQFPNDLMTYQRLIVETDPDYVIELGTLYGGLSLYLATVLQALGDEAKVITVDIRDEPWKQTVETGNIPERLLQRVIFIHGDSVSDAVTRRISEMVTGKKVLVILDSSHETEHVLEELRLYSKLIPVGDYLVVNDTHLDHTKDIGRVSGPMAAVRRFLDGNGDFVIDSSKQPFMISCFHSGILRRVR